MKPLKNEELEAVIGGASVNKAGNAGVKKNTSQTGVGDTKEVYCPDCKKKTVFNLYLGGRAICQECGKEIML